MQKRILSRAFCAVLCILLIAASALTMTGCGEKAPAETPSDAQSTVKFTFKVVDLEGKETTVEIDTAEKTVGAALLAKHLIAGDQSGYGLYVKTVNGVTLDYNTDKAYWAFYVGDAYAETGVDNTPITAGETYTFKAEKAG